MSEKLGDGQRMSDAKGENGGVMRQTFFTEDEIRMPKWHKHHPGHHFYTAVYLRVHIHVRWVERFRFWAWSWEYGGRDETFIDRSGATLQEVQELAVEYVNNMRIDEEAARN